MFFIIHVPIVFSSEWCEYYIHYYKNVFSHKFYYYAYVFQCNKHFLLLQCSGYTNAHAQLNSTKLD